MAKRLDTLARAMLDSRDGGFVSTSGHFNSCITVRMVRNFEVTLTWTTTPLLRTSSGVGRQVRSTEQGGVRFLLFENSWKTFE